MILCKFYYIILRQKYSLVLFIFNVVHGNICSVFVSLTFTVVQLTSFCRRPGKSIISYVQGVSISASDLQNPVSISVYTRPHYAGLNTIRKWTH